MSKSVKSPLNHLDSISRMGLRVSIDEVEMLESELDAKSALARQMETASKTLWEECHQIKERRVKVEDTIRRISRVGSFVDIEM